MTLELVKVEEGLMAGDVLYHSFVSKTKAQVKELKKRKRDKYELKISRKRQQEANVARKQSAKEAKESAKMNRKASLMKTATTPEAKATAEALAAPGVISDASSHTLTAR